MEYELTNDRRARAFIRTFLFVVVAGTSLTALVALLIDPLHTFGTGRMRSMLTNEREEKPEAFLRLKSAPEAIVLGTSRVMKLRPDCIRELTGFHAFNFGLSNALVEDWQAAYRFVVARGKSPIRELIIGVDVEAFDSHAVVDQRLRSSSRLSEYMGVGSGITWSDATRALFGLQAFQYGLSSIWYALRPQGPPPASSTFDPEGFITYTSWENQIRTGTFSPERPTAEMAVKLANRNYVGTYEALSPMRVAMFRELIERAHLAGIEIDVFIPPMHPALSTARAFTALPAREQEVDAMLSQLEHVGLVRYLRVRHVEDFGGDPAGFFDGAHMMESNASRLLLKMFHRQHGCGV